MLNLGKCLHHYLQVDFDWLVQCIEKLQVFDCYWIDNNVAEVDQTWRLNCTSKNSTCTVFAFLWVFLYEDKSIDLLTIILKRSDGVSFLLHASFSFALAGWAKRPSFTGIPFRSSFSFFIFSELNSCQCGSTWKPTWLWSGNFFLLPILIIWTKKGRRVKEAYHF